MVKRKDVRSVKQRKGKRGQFAVVMVADGKNLREEFVFGPCAAKLKKPGVYDFTYGQNRMGYLDVIAIAPVTANNKEK